MLPSQKRAFSSNATQYRYGQRSRSAITTHFSKSLDRIVKIIFTLDNVEVLSWEVAQPDFKVQIIHSSHQLQRKIEKGNSAGKKTIVNIEKIAIIVYEKSPPAPHSPGPHGRTMPPLHFLTSQSKVHIVCAYTFPSPRTFSGRLSAPSHRPGIPRGSLRISPCLRKKAEQRQNMGHEDKVQICRGE